MHSKLSINFQHKLNSVIIISCLITYGTENVKYKWFSWSVTLTTKSNHIIDHSYRNKCSPLSFPQLHRFTHPPECCAIKSLCTFQQPLHLKMKFSIKEFFSKCDQICNFLQICSHLLKKSLTENFIFCAVNSPTLEHKKDYSLTLNNLIIKRDI